MKTNKINTVILMLLAMLITGCHSTPVPSILEGSPCSPPCWHNIVPALTTEQEAKAILESLPEIDLGTIISKGEPWKIFNNIIFFSFNTKGREGKIFFIDGKVAMIELDGDTGLTIGKAIEQFGEPDSVLNNPTAYGGWFPVSSSLNYTIRLFKPSKGIAFAYVLKDVPWFWRKEIRPEIKVSEITFFDPNLYERIFDVAWGTLFYIKPWAGYGEIEKKYPPANTGN